MTFLTLDSIVRSALLQKRLSLHYYIDFLLYGKDCLRELTFDDLAVINTAALPINQDDMTAELPPDYRDYIDVSAMSGQFLKHLVPVNNMNPKQAFSNGLPTLYGNNDNNSGIFSNLAAGYFWRTVTWNQYGENIGRLFGFNTGYTDNYQIFKERNQIQFNEQASVTVCILRYISNGMTLDAASMVDEYAYMTILNYIFWQCKEHNRAYSPTERKIDERRYEQQRGILRARMADWSIEKVKRIATQSKIAAPKG